MKRKYLVLGILGVFSAFVLVAGRPAHAEGGPDANITFTRDVAPIILKNCAVCHRPGTVAPMSLLNYKEVRPWARSISEAVSDHTMPPWHADPHYGDFSNNRRLAQRDIDTIVAWVKAGAKEGNPADMPPSPKFDEDGWSIGKPDAVLAMTEVASVPKEGSVAYRYFVVPTNFAEDKYVVAAEIHRGNNALVHHTIISVREPGQGPLPAAGEIKLGEGPGENRGPGAGAGGGNRGGGRGNNADGQLIGWAPGMSPMILRDGQAKMIKKGSVLIFQQHYTTNGEAGTDRTSVGLIFAKTPVEKRIVTTGAFARDLDIPPGDGNFATHATFVFNQDSHLISFMPHMHLRGKDFEYKLVFPDGTSKIVLEVPKYDFNWQTTYIMREPIAVPKGTKLECVAHFDNSTNNKYNPDPTRRVTWGEQTWEEMMIGWLEYTIDSQDLRQETAALAKGQ